MKKLLILIYMFFAKSVEKTYRGGGKIGHVIYAFCINYKYAVGRAKDEICRKAFNYDVYNAVEQKCKFW